MRSCHTSFYSLGGAPSRTPGKVHNRRGKLAPPSAAPRRQCARKNGRCAPWNSLLSCAHSSCIVGAGGTTDSPPSIPCPSGPHNGFLPTHPRTTVGTLNGASHRKRLQRLPRAGGLATEAIIRPPIRLQPRPAKSLCPSRRPAGLGALIVILRASDYSQWLLPKIQVTPRIIQAPHTPKFAASPA